MKHIKKFENSELKIGDYVIGNNITRYTEDISTFINNTVGSIRDRDHNFAYVRYDKMYDIRKLRPDENNLIAILKADLRQATPEEIENELIKNRIEKYNI